MIYLTLFLEFFKVGLFSVGGGLATIPFLSELATKYNWFDQKTLMDMIAVSQSTPGAIGVNMATFAGFKASGILGGCRGERPYRMRRERSDVRIVVGAS